MPAVRSAVSQSRRQTSGGLRSNAATIVEWMNPGGRENPPRDFSTESGPGTDATRRGRPSGQQGTWREQLLLAPATLDLHNNFANGPLQFNFAPK